MNKCNPQKTNKIPTNQWKNENSDENKNVLQVVPHQFLGRLLPTVKAAMRNDAISVSLIKGMATGDVFF